MAHASPATVSRDRIRHDVAELLGVTVDEIDDSDNLLDEGLDSVRVMTLLERWRDSGAQIDIVDLVSEPTVDAWTRVLGEL